jgi:thioredoxin 2
MSFTLAPCENCEKINRVPLGRAEAEAPICGNCKRELPLEHGISHVTGTTLRRLIDRANLPVIADFWTPTCVPCRAFEPEFQRAAMQMGGKIIFAKLNCQKHSLAASVYGIRSVPTLILFQGGVETERRYGAISSAELLEWLNSIEQRSAA